MRRVRALLDDLGHETFVLARPTKAGVPPPRLRRALRRLGPARRDRGLRVRHPWEDYERWLDATRVETVLCFQNYDFVEVRRVRERGVRTIGTFMWEAFGPEHVAGAVGAYDVVYALTRSGRDRFAELGVDAPYVPWGCHPEDIADAARPARWGWSRSTSREATSRGASRSPRPWTPSPTSTIRGCVWS